MEPDQTYPASPLPSGSAARKTLPIATGVLDYFPAALAEVAKLSKFGNDKHNPGLPLHHARGKSSDHADCIMRHLIDRGKPDADMGGLSHSVAVAWRALALLQEEMEAAGAPLARGARKAEPTYATFDPPETQPAPRISGLGDAHGSDVTPERLVPRR